MKLLAVTFVLMFWMNVPAAQAHGQYGFCQSYAEHVVETNDWLAHEEDYNSVKIVSHKIEGVSSDSHLVTFVMLAGYEVDKGAGQLNSTWEIKLLVSDDGSGLKCLRSGLKELRSR